VIADPVFYALAVPATLLAGISKGGFGGGIGFAGLMLMTFIMSPVQAAALFLPILCVMDLVGVWAYRRSWHRPSMTALLPGGLVGIAAGTLTFGLLSDAAIKVVVGALALAFALDHWIGRRERAAPAAPSAAKGAFWGAVSGYTSFLVHAGAPAFSVYMLPKKLDKSVFVGTSVMFFFIVNYVKLPPYAWLGLLEIGNLATSAALMPLAAAAMYLGVWMQRRVPGLWFYRVCYAMLFVTGAKLVLDEAAPLIRAIVHD